VTYKRYGKTGSGISRILQENSSDEVKARDPKAKTTNIKAKAVIHKKAKDKAAKAKVFLIKATTNKQNINVCCINIIQYSAFTVKQ